MPASIEHRSSSPWPRLVAVFVVIWLLAAAGAGRAATIIASPQVVTGTPQTVLVGQTLPQKFEVVVRTPSGQALAGVQVYFTVNVCLEGVPPPGGGCPDGALYGTFPGNSLSAAAVTDAHGRARAPVFTAGTLTGQYEVYAEVPAQTLGADTIPFSSIFAFFQIRQVTGYATAIPMLSNVAMGMVVLGLALIGARRLRWKGASRG